METQLLAYLLAAATSLSGLPEVAVESLPPVAVVSADALHTAACPMKQEQCREIVALFDSDEGRVLVSDTLDLASPADNSFLVHELVHVLEYRYRGRAPQGCPETLRSERLAYRVQNAYLRREGRPERFGGLMMRMVCAPDQPGDSTIRLQLGRSQFNDEMALREFMEDLTRDRIRR